MFDNHIHSKFSTDSHMEAIAACESALETGLKGLTFTDHVDFDYPDFDDSMLIDYEEYFHFFEKLKSDWQDRLNIQIGIEMGYQPHVLDNIVSLLDKYSFDFIINSVHVIDKMDPYTKTYYQGKTQREAYERYLNVVLESVTAYDNYDVIGHIGYVARYGDFDDKPLKYRDYTDILDQILMKTLEKGKGIEINTSGLRTDLKTPIPGYDILKRYLELGGEIITVGSDAHFKEHIAHSFDEALKYLKNIGFNYVVHYENRKPVFDKI